MNLGCALTLLLLLAPMAQAIEPFRIDIVEKGSGWPVPLVELRTTHQVRFVSDNAGVIALDAPELMHREVWFDVSGNGYSVPKDGFGMRGVRFHPRPGQSAKVEVSREIIAKRLGRLTGAGLFAESQKLGQELAWEETGIFGCDSVQNAVHNGKLFWAWGDTTLPGYPLGIFHMTSATTGLQPLTSFQPPVHLNYTYFRENQGKPRGVAQMPGEGPTWVDGYVSVPDRDGVAHLVGTYIKVKPPMDAYQCGLCVWNEAKAAFESHRVLWNKSPENPKEPLRPGGHPVLWSDAQNRSWLLFGNPFPTLRCRAAFEAWEDPARWEKLTPPETLVSADGAKVRPHSGALAWNAYRKRWVALFMEAFGKPSAFGELWYAEAESPLGPWGTAVKVLSHENYTFYNPQLHPGFTAVDSPILLFEATYTMQFTDHAFPTARYDYNQVLYRLDLDDPALGPARGPLP